MFILSLLIHVLLLGRVIYAWQYVNSKQLNLEWQKMKTCKATDGNDRNTCNNNEFGSSLDYFNYNDPTFIQYVHSITSNNTLIISFITFPLIQHYNNFHCHIKKLNLEKLV